MRVGDRSDSGDPDCWESEQLQSALASDGDGGGIDEQGKWREVKAISYDYLHREWQRQLFAMMEEQARSMEMAALLEALRKEYERGLVVYREPRAVKAGNGLARYL